MSFKTTAGITVGKLGNLAISLIAKNRGTNWAGETAMRIDPELIAHIKGIDADKVIFITGTDGKSTVTNLVAHILRYNGFSVVSNLEGANLTTGVATSLLKASSLGGNVKADYFVFETDERYLYQIREQLPCNNLIVTNILKDQMQRNGDPDYIYRKIRRVIEKFGMNVFLNGDEPRSCSLADYAPKTVFYGAEKHSQAFTKDDTFVTLPCPKCQCSIKFDYYNNDSLGSFHCDKCGYTNNNGNHKEGRRRQADYRSTNADFAARTFRINGTEYTMPYDPPHMLYNYAAATAACKEIAGLTEAQCAEALKSFKLLAGRIESVTYKGRHIKFMRFKQENPETFQNFINTIAADKEDKVVIIGLDTVNDIDPFYMNTFYAFDCDYSQLIRSNVKRFYFVTDTVAYDAANCFMYGGVDPSRVDIIPTGDEEEILDIIEDCGYTNIYLAVTLHKFEIIQEMVRKGK